MDRAKLKQELGRPEYAGLDAEQIRAAILAAGITRVEFERKRDGRTERHEVE